MFQFFTMCALFVLDIADSCLQAYDVKTLRWLSNFFVASRYTCTYLLATQQQNLLAIEADDLHDLTGKEGISRNDVKKVKDLQLRTR